MNRMNIVNYLLKDHKGIKRPILGEENLVIVVHKLLPIAEESSILCYPRPFKSTNGAMTLSWHVFMSDWETMESGVLQKRAFELWCDLW